MLHRQLVARQLRKAIRSQQMTRIAIAHSLEHLHGFPLAATDEFVVVQTMHDFAFDGWSVVPLNNIGEVRSGKFERVAKRIIAKETTRTPRTPARIGLNSLQSLLHNLKSARTIVQVETEQLQSTNRDVGEKTFLIGRIIEVAQNSMQLHNFSALGTWDRHPTTVALNKIALIEFGTRYAAIWSRHLPKRPSRTSK